MELAEIPSADSAIRAATQTARVIEILKELNDAPNRGELPQLDIRFLETVDPDELLRGRFALVGKLIEREFPGTVVTGFPMRFVHQVSCLSILLQDALAGFDGSDPATWCIRPLVDVEPDNARPDYRNRFFELSHCLLTGESENGFPEMPVRSSTDDPQVFRRKLGGEDSAIGFEYRMGSDQTITPISWGEGLQKGEPDRYKWPRVRGERSRPQPSEKMISAALESARAKADMPVRVPVCYRGRIEARLPIFIGNDWDPRPDRRGDNADPDRRLAF